MGEIESKCVKTFIFQMSMHFRSELVTFDPQNYVVEQFRVE